jgi:myo-inositol 2-dehydrogenase/D-chiro-inositol 1-dehydrogenase
MTSSRRAFLKTSTIATAGATLFGGLPDILRGQTGPGRGRKALPIRVGLIGCGGRGRGAARDALTAAEGVQLVALADLFPDHLAKAYATLREKRPDIDIPPSRQFSGWDAYQKLLALEDVNYVILATPPGFRPLHFQAAIEAGKHVFTEKPVAVDGPGIRTVLAAGDIARQKGLAVVAGTQRRHQADYLQTVKRLRDGAVGEIVSAYCYWNQGSMWHKNREPAWSDMEYQVRNWNYFTWLSGDHYVEQHIHNIDVVNWILGAHPVSATGMGGRQARTGPEFGHIYDHFAVQYEYANGAVLLSEARQIDNCDNRIGELVIGLKGRSNCRDRIEPRGKSPWTYAGPKYTGEGTDAPGVDPYVREHADLIASIRAGKPLDETRTIAETNLTAIMGRMAAYSGLVVDWQTALDSQESQFPPKLEFGPLPTPAVPIPGKYQLT